jgi:hypothetical protein
VAADYVELRKGTIEVVNTLLSKGAFFGAAVSTE